MGPGILMLQIQLLSSVFILTELKTNLTRHFIFVVIGHAILEILDGILLNRP